MPREFSRTRRVEEQIQRELAELIRSSVKDPRLGMVTVSGVEVSRDLGHAKVYVTVLGDEEKRDQSMQVLKRAAGYLRRELGRSMFMRSVPELHFHYDQSIEQGMQLDKLIDAAVAEDTAKHEPQ